MRLALGVLFAIIAAPAFGQVAEPWVFERIHSGDGLSHNSVYAIQQDREGFMWFGTVDGLNRFDGYDFVVFRHDPSDSQTLSSNLVHALHADEDGSLWVGTQVGLDRLAVGANGFDRFEVPLDAETGFRQVQHIARGPDGAIWFAGSAGVVRLDPETARMDVVLELPGFAASYFETHDDGVWALMTNDGDGGDFLVSIDAQSREVQEQWQVPAEWGSRFRFYRDNTGAFWFGPEGPAQLVGNRLAVDRVDVSGSKFGILFDGEDGLVIGTDGSGIDRCNTRTGECSRQWVDPVRTTWLHNYVRGMYRDQAGGLWVGTYGGVYRVAPDRKPFVVHRHSGASGGLPANDAISAALKSRDGTLWVSTYGSGLSRLDPQTRRLTHVPSVSGDVVWALHEDASGIIWIGGDDGLFWRSSSSGEIRRVSPSLPGLETRVTSIQSAPDGSLWIGSSQGLSRRTPDGTWVAYEVTGDSSGPSHTSVGTLLVDGNSLWIGLAGGDLNRLDLRTMTFESLPLRDASGKRQSSEGVYDLASDQKGGVWIATGAGLFHYFEGEFEHFATWNGLPGSVIYSIQPEPTGVLWLGTNRGLARFDRESGQVRSFDLRDGIGMMEFNRHARFRDADGTLYFGGDGLLQFHPDQVGETTRQPAVVLTSIESASRDGVRLYNPRGLNHLTLEPGETTATFSFAALGFSVPERQQYRYQLAGFDEGWVEAGGQRQARYTNVPPGTYTFRVLASNADGVWSETGLSLPVTVEPAYWQTLWFRGLFGLAVLLGVAAIYRARVQRLLGLERLRLRIASDLHDDLAGDLSGIAFAADLVRQRAGPGVDRDRLREIRDTASGMVDALRDIVWTINPEHDTMEALVRRMRAVARQLLANHEHSFEADLSAEAVPMPIRHDLLLLYKEALHNAVRHAEASRVDVEIARTNGHLVLTVRDDGQGFDPTTAKDGHGLRSMRQRAEKMGGTLGMETAPERGTRLYVCVPIARTRDRRTGPAAVS